MLSFFMMNQPGVIFVQSLSRDLSRIDGCCSQQTCLLAAIDHIPPISQFCLARQFLQRSRPLTEVCHCAESLPDDLHIPSIPGTHPYEQRVYPFQVAFGPVLYAVPGWQRQASSKNVCPTFALFFIAGGHRRRWYCCAAESFRLHLI